MIRPGSRGAPQKRLDNISEVFPRGSRWASAAAEWLEAVEEKITRQKTEAKLFETKRVK